jgi:Alkylmercury lyase
MLFFRSEERVAEWCRRQGVTVRPILTLEQLWLLAAAWYENRLSPDARRPKPEEVRSIFARIGLTGSFWDPSSDQFG